MISVLDRGTLGKHLRVWLVAAALAAAACGRPKPAPPRVLGEAYILPETLDLRADLPRTSSVTAKVKRGEHVEIVGRRRRFVRVRTADGREGWTEQNQLLTPEMARQIEQVSKQAAQTSSLGVYRARDLLNVHLEPYRWSPSIEQLKEEEQVNLLGRRVVDRLPEPPAGGPPPVPEPGKTYSPEEWSFIRAAGGRAGWVLGRMVYAGIPDEVAQYAEGRRITSYYALGEVPDGEQRKKIWLWTTTTNATASYDFDSFRVFNWSRRRHRYETASIERGLQGYFPVTVTASLETRYGTGPGFSFVIAKEGGQRYLRRYVMIGYLVRRYAEEPAPAAASSSPATPPAPPAEEPEESPGFFRRLWRRLRS
jgi:hypothetical protein